MKIKPNAFRFEIGVVLIVKLILIVSLKILFFSDPADRNLNQQDVEGHWFEAAPASASPLFIREDSCHAQRTGC